MSTNRSASALRVSPIVVESGKWGAFCGNILTQGSPLAAASTHASTSVIFHPTARVDGPPSRRAGGNSPARIRRQIVVLLRPTSSTTSFKRRICLCTIALLSLGCVLYLFVEVEVEDVCALASSLTSTLQCREHPSGRGMLPLDSVSPARSPWQAAHWARFLFSGHPIKRAVSVVPNLGFALRPLDAEWLA